VALTMAVKLKPALTSIRLPVRLSTSSTSVLDIPDPLPETE
jgi:hypothetical protein